MKLALVGAVKSTKNAVAALPNYFLNSVTQKQIYNRRHPFLAKLKHTELLTKPGSLKDTRHYVIDLHGSGITFEPGDSLAIQPSNCPDLVDELLQNLNFHGKESVLPSPLVKEEVTLRDALLHFCDITQPDKKLLTYYSAHTNRAHFFKDLLDPSKKRELTDFLYGREVIDLLLQFPEIKFTAQTFISLLKKLQIRLYSIANSPTLYPDEIHLTVATVRYESRGRKRKGVCSTFLAERITMDTPIPCFITPGKGFRLPSPQEDIPLILCGPGTGIAPFRAFLQERKATQAKGKVWLFFGEQQKAYDFFYQQEFEKALEENTLTKLTTAFSRDQEEKIYVQHRMHEHATEIFQWLEQGAIFYICGDAQYMAKDVDTALHQIVEQEGKKTAAEAKAYLEKMREEKRYRRDVY